MSCEVHRRYLRLFEPMEAHWGLIDVRHVFELGDPPAHLVSNVRAVCFSGDRVLAIRTKEFDWSVLPGGTLEPGEPVLEGLRRELMEEAGARVDTWEVFAGMHFWSSAPAPFRPHVPHPEFYWVVGFADVEIVGPPTQPPDGETVLSVELLTLPDAERLLGDPEAWQLDVVRLAEELRRARG